MWKRKSGSTGVCTRLFQIPKRLVASLEPKDIPSLPRCSGVRRLEHLGEDKWSVFRSNRSPPIHREGLGGGLPSSVRTSSSSQLLDRRRKGFFSVVCTWWASNGPSSPYHMNMYGESCWRALDLPISRQHTSRSFISSGLSLDKTFGNSPRRSRDLQNELMVTLSVGPETSSWSGFFSDPSWIEKFFSMCEIRNLEHWTRPAVSMSAFDCFQIKGTIDTRRCIWLSARSRKRLSAAKVKQNSKADELPPSHYVSLCKAGRYTDKIYWARVWTPYNARLQCRCYIFRNMEATLVE